ncbi:MAG: hypothetical protein AAF235_06255 [Planctomycetota bacterium]
MQPVELVRGDPPDTSGDATGSVWPPASLGFALVAAVILVGIIAVHLASSRRRRLPVAERAFRAMASAQAIRPRRRRLVRALADAHGGVKPVALLVSDAAMRDAVDAFRASKAEFPPGTGIEDLASLVPGERSR